MRIHTRLEGDESGVGALAVDEEERVPKASVAAGEVVEASAPEREAEGAAGHEAALHGGQVAVRAEEAVEDAVGGLERDDAVEGGLDEGADAGGVGGRGRYGSEG